MIGKPYSGKLNVRFDEGELEIEPRLLRQFPTLPFDDIRKQEIGKRINIFFELRILGYALKD